MMYFLEYMNELSKFISDLDFALLKSSIDLIQKTCQRRNKIIIIGNGGSAAIASHVSVDLVKTAGLRAINFNEADLITCFSNDYGYEYWLEKALEAYADDGDLLISISSSGKSRNVINATTKAKDMGLEIITFSGFSGRNPLRSMGLINFWVDSEKYNIVEMTHHVWLSAMVDYLSERSDYSGNNICQSHHSGESRNPALIRLDAGSGPA
jgi:D-sedoheptulose 7-phosphate isomerase